MQIIIEIHQDTLVDIREIKRSFVKPRHRQKNNKKMHKRSITEKREVNQLGT